MSQSAVLKQTII